MKAFYVLILLASFVSTAAPSLECKDDCTFVLMEDSGNVKTIKNVKRARQAFTPYSTFKIPNTLIALDTGVVENLTQKLSFDAKKYPVQAWWPEIWHKAPLTIRPAFQYSAVPVYQEIATRIGQDEMQDYLDDFDYGNQDISSGLDTFWLNGSIKISAIEQVQFLKRLFSGELSVSEQSLTLFKQVMLKEENENYTLYAKTGGGPLAKDKAIGWYVGIVDKGDNVYYFAVNLEGKSFSEVQQKRMDVAMSELKKAGVLD